MSGKQFLYVIVITLITALAWVTLDILHSRSQVQIPPEVQKLITPLNPQLDQKVINDL